jgi:hypothetical protein
MIIPTICLQHRTSSAACIDTHHPADNARIQMLCHQPESVVPELAAL